LQTKRVPFTYSRRGFFYFTRRIPNDLLQHYETDRIVEGLRTKSPSVAKLRSLMAAAKLEEYWHQLRVANPNLPGVHRLRSPVGTNDIKGTHVPEQDVGPKLSESLEQYFRHKGKDKSKVFFNISRRACGYLIDVAGDQSLGRYTRADAIAFRDRLTEKGLVGSSVGRLLNCLTAIFNFNIQEFALTVTNPLSGIYLDKKAGVKKRQALTLAEINKVQDMCRAENDDIRWLIALISDTGMRLAEAAGLRHDDFDLTGKIPIVQVRTHPWRSLKTESSKRTLPLVGHSLWAAERIVASTDPDGFAFPRYNKGNVTSANSASASINKWLRPHVGEDSTLHSFRHSMRDRLRAVECPSDVVDQIGGWTTGGIGQSYGDGYPVAVLEKWLREAVKPQ
jgi:integrase